MIVGARGGPRAGAVRVSRTSAYSARITGAPPDEQRCRCRRTARRRRGGELPNPSALPEPRVARPSILDRPSQQSRAGRLTSFSSLNPPSVFSPPFWTSLATVCPNVVACLPALAAACWNRFSILDLVVRGVTVSVSRDEGSSPTGGGSRLRAALSHGCAGPARNFSRRQVTPLLCAPARLVRSSKQHRCRKHLVTARRCARRARPRTRARSAGPRSRR